MALNEKTLSRTHCAHGSQWIWTQALQQWFTVLLAPDCDCGTPSPGWPENDARAMAELREARAEERRGRAG